MLISKVEQAEDIDSEHDVWKELGGQETIQRLKRIEENNKIGMSIVDRLLGKNRQEADQISDLRSISEDSDDMEFTKKSEVLEFLKSTYIEQLIGNEV